MDEMFDKEKERNKSLTEGLAYERVSKGWQAGICMGGGWIVIHSAGCAKAPRFGLASLVAREGVKCLGANE